MRTRCIDSVQTQTSQDVFPMPRERVNERFASIKVLSARPTLEDHNVGPLLAR